ncbi:MAG TPA: hypothetical protein VK956_01640, partial [Verrucomicrobium sp.]|nr:hypothetical protein [Verrucomicrobium sp.]
YTTTEGHLNLASAKEPTTALDLVQTLHDIVTPDGNLVVNTYRRNAATQLLELFGRRFDYRRRENLLALMAEANFHPHQLVGSGHVYDVEVYGKKPLTQD